MHFAFTMAAMARTLGIPARVDGRLRPGHPPVGRLRWSVGLKDAHAWPELYFQGVGWTRFEPTPSRGTAPDYTQDPSATGGGSDLPLPHAAPPPPGRRPGRPTRRPASGSPGA